jgi:hypothetical protein
MCNLELDFSKRYAPVYGVPAEKLADGVALPARRSFQARANAPDDEKYLRQLCEDGLEWRYGTRTSRRRSASGWSMS